MDNILVYTVYHIKAIGRHSFIGSYFELHFSIIFIQRVVLENILQKTK